MEECKFPKKHKSVKQTSMDWTHLAVFMFQSVSMAACNWCFGSVVSTQKHFPTPFERWIHLINVIEIFVINNAKIETWALRSGKRIE